MGKLPHSIVGCTLILLLVQFLCAASVLAEPDVSSQDNSHLAELEKRLFFQSYSQQELPTRLNRIEKRVFGEIMSGSVEERISRISSATKSQINPDGLAPRVVRDAQPEVSEDVSSSSMSAQPSGVSKNDLAVNKQAAEPEDQDCALERAKIAVMAAKEEEITHLLSEGVELWRARRGQEALEKFEQVIRLDPRNSEAHFSMGIIEEASGNLVEAISSYRLALKARPDNVEYKEAIKAVEKKLTAKSHVDTKQSEIRILSEDAIAAFRRGEFISALDLYKQLDLKNPGQALVKYNIGTIFLMVKQPERALDYYKQARKLAPGDQRFIAACAKLEGVVQQDSKQVKNELRENRQVSKDDSASKLTQGRQAALEAYGILGKSGSQGVVITTVNTDTKAAQAGLQRGDIIRAIDGTIVSSPSELNQLLMQKAGAPIQVMVQRDKKLAQVAL